jgi:gas vesicle protein
MDYTIFARKVPGSWEKRPWKKEVFIMPCIQIKTNVQVSNETAQTVKSQLGRIITHLPEKTEDWLMVTLEDQCRMCRGEGVRKQN